MIINVRYKFDFNIIKIMHDTKIVEKFYHHKWYIKVWLFFIIFKVEKALRSVFNLCTHEEIFLLSDGHHDDRLHDEPG